MLVFYNEDNNYASYILIRIQLFVKRLKTMVVGF